MSADTCSGVRWNGKVTVLVSMSMSGVGSAVGVSAAGMEDCIIGDAPHGAVSAVAMVVDGVGGGGAEERVFLALDAVGFLVMGRRGQPRESWPTVLHCGHALSELGQDAMILKSIKSNKGGAERVEPLLGSLSTMSQQLVKSSLQPFTVCGPMAIISLN